MRRLIVVFLAVVLVVQMCSAVAVEKVTDREDLSSYIAMCEQFDMYGEIAEALVCAACIPYGESPEQCVEYLQNKGFQFEYGIAADLPYNVTPADITYDVYGHPTLPMIREVGLFFSETVTLYLRTEAHSIVMKRANDEAGMPEGNIWTPNEPIPEGSIIAAHLQFFDENVQEWITWTFMSPEQYKEAYFDDFSQ